MSTHSYCKITTKNIYIKFYKLPNMQNLKIEKYNCTMRFFHWFLFLFISFNLIVGLVMKYSSAVSIDKIFWYGLHKSIGVSIILFVFMRIIARFCSKIPPHSEKIAKKYVIMAKLNIFLLYFCMIAVPLSGFIMSDAGPYGVSWFGYKLPSLMEQNNQTSYFSHELHSYFSYMFIALIGLHILATIRHFIFDKTNLLKRII
ncbi:MAG: cytochrome b561 [Candidatus Midichloriaceae bacterium]|jgi:cytochrome b561